MDNRAVPKDILPTLIIGLGGTGYQVIKRLKQLFRKRYSNERLPVRYLLIDTDLKSFLDDSIENNEKCQLRFGDGIKNTLDWAYKNPNFDWLPENPKITPDFFTSTDQGAGLMRPIGRLYLCKNAKFVYDVLSTAKNDLVDLHKVLTDLGSAYLENIDRHKVYIVGSLAGGTGCGTFLDVAIMLSKIFNRDTTNIIGMFTLESCYDDKLSSDVDAQNRSKANCYAALKELEFYMSSITKANDEKYLFKYNNVGEIRLEKKLLDVCYLIENKNELGGVLSNIEDIYDLCSLQLFQEVGTKLGSQLRADYANFICKDKDPVLKRDRHFSTFSSSTMEFPIDNLKNYCSVRFAKEVVERLEKSYEGADLSGEWEEILNKINEIIGFNELLIDFGGNLKINDRLLVGELKEGKKGNLDKILRFSEDRRHQWFQQRTETKNYLQCFLKDYINEGIRKKGIRFTLDILKEIEEEMYRQYCDSLVTTSIDKEKLKGEIDRAESVKGFVKKEELTVDREFCSRFNKYIDQEQNRLRQDMFKARYDMFLELEDQFSCKLSSGLTNLTNIKNYIGDMLSKLSSQSEKRYGGNIISREMVNTQFYEDFYAEKYEGNIEDRVNTILLGDNLWEAVLGDAEKILNICKDEFERLKGNLDIMKVLEKNAMREGVTLNEYIKEELNVTSKLAKPFWSAIKNPEVSWTECYYIGAVKDETMNNGFTVKPPEAIDRWIRNQTGERSRQARYVETTNPYAIDIIHITMGACAAYLPDVKSYKQFYLKLLASETYPLHLDEKYVGLEELDVDANSLFDRFSMGRALGAILELQKEYYVNLRLKDGAYNYIYNSPYCLKGAYLEEKLMDIPENKIKLKEVIYLGENKNEALLHISEDEDIRKLLYDFIDEVQRLYTAEELKKHYLDVYIGGKEKPDFISKEKLLNKLF